jgi:hypothetical protein
MLRSLDVTPRLRSAQVLREALLLFPGAALRSVQGKPLATLAPHCKRRCDIA